MENYIYVDKSFSVMMRKEYHICDEDVNKAMTDIE